MLKIVVEADPNLAAIGDAIRELEAIRASLTPVGGINKAAGPEEAEIVTLYLRSGEGTRSRQLLEVLPTESEGGLTPTELGQKLPPDSSGAVLQAASVRAVLRNIFRARLHLRSEGLLESGTDLVCVDWSGYANETAGRYYLTDADHAALRAYLRDA